MTKIEISRHHAIPIAELKERLEALREKFAEGPPTFVTIWSGNLLKIAGPGFKGTIELGIDRVELEASLGLLLLPLKPSIEAQLGVELDQLVMRRAS